MEITSNSWRAYIQKLNQINSKAGELMEAWVEKHGLEDRNALIEYAYSLSSHYGEASAAITCQMYDEITMAEGLTLPDAVPSPTASMDEVAKAVNGSLKQSPTGQLLNSVLYRLSKQASADTMLHNAARDGAEFAWVPVGDTCAFCITLASRGWQRATASLLNTHAEHIHAHCDCTFAVRHDKNSKVGGYDPDEYRRMYDNADGKNAREKINSIRRMKYQENKDRINARNKDINYKPVIRSDKLIENFGKEQVMNIREIIGSRNNICISDKAKLKRRELHDLEQQIDYAKRVSKVSGDSRYVVVSDSELNNTAAGKFDPDTGNIYIKIMNDKEQQKHTIIHESFHKKDYEDFLANGNKYTDKNAYIEATIKLSKTKLDKVGIDGYNVNTISSYATDMYRRGRYDEAYTEYRTVHALKVE